MNLLRLINIYILFTYTIFFINLELFSYTGWEEHEEFILSLFKDKNIEELYLDLEKGNRESVDEAKQVIIFNLYEYFLKKTNKKIPNYNNSNLYSFMVAIEEYMKKNNNGNQLNDIEYKAFFQKYKMPYLDRAIYEELVILVLNIEFELKRIFQKRSSSFKSHKIIPRCKEPSTVKKNNFYCDIEGTVISKPSSSGCKIIKASRIIDGLSLDSLLDDENIEIVCLDFTSDNVNEVISKNRIFLWANLLYIVKKSNNFNESKKIIFCFPNENIYKEVISKNIVIHDFIDINDKESYNIVEVSEKDDLNNLLSICSVNKPNLFLFSISHNMDVDKKLESIQDAIKKFLIHKVSIFDRFAYRRNEDKLLLSESDNIRNIYKSNRGKIISMPSEYNKVDLGGIDFGLCKFEKFDNKNNRNFSLEIKSILLNEIDSLEIDNIDKLKKYILFDVFDCLNKKITDLLKSFDIITIDNFEINKVLRIFFNEFQKKNSDFLINEKEMAEISMSLNRKIIYNMQFRIIEDSKKIVIYYIPSLKNELVDLSAFKEVLFLNRSEIEEKVIEECVNSVFKQIINKNKSSMQYYLNPDDLKSLLNRLIGEVPHILILSRDEIRRLLFDLYTIHNDQKLTLQQKIIARYEIVAYTFDNLSNIVLKEYFSHRDNKLKPVFFKKYEYMPFEKARTILEEYFILPKDIEELSLYCNKDYKDANNYIDEKRYFIAIAKIIHHNENRFYKINNDKDQSLIAKYKELNMNELKKSLLYVDELHFDRARKINNIFVKADNSSNLLIEIIEKRKKQEELANKNRSSGSGPTMPTFHLLTQEDLELVNAAQVTSPIKKHIQISIEKYLNAGDPYGVIDSCIVGGVSGAGKSVAFSYYASECMKAREKLGASNQDIYYVVLSELKSSFVSGGDAKFKAIINIADELYERNKKSQMYILIDEADSVFVDHSAGGVQHNDEKKYNPDFENSFLQNYQPDGKHKHVKFFFTSNKQLKDFLNPAVLTRVNKGREVIWVEHIENPIIFANLIAALRRDNITLKDEEKFRESDIFRLKNILGETQRSDNWWRNFIMHLNQITKHKKEKSVEDFTDLLDIYEAHNMLERDSKVLSNVDLGKFNINEEKNDPEKMSFVSGILDNLIFKGVGPIATMIAPKAPLIMVGALAGSATGHFVAECRWWGADNRYFGRQLENNNIVGGVSGGVLWGGIFGAALGFLSQVNLDEGEISFPAIENFFAKTFSFEKKKKPKEAERKIDSIEKLSFLDNKTESEIEMIEFMNVKNQIPLNKKTVINTYSNNFVSFFHDRAMHNKEIFFKLSDDKQSEFLINKKEKWKEFLHIVGVEKEYSNINLFLDLPIKEQNDDNMFNNLDFKKLLFNISFNGTIINYPLLEYINNKLNHFANDHNINKRYEEYRSLKAIAMKYPHNLALSEQVEAGHKILHITINDFLNQMKQNFFNERIIKGRFVWFTNISLGTILNRKNKEREAKAEDKNKIYLKYLDKIKKEEEEENKNREYLAFAKMKKDEESESEDDKPYDGL